MSSPAAEEKARARRVAKLLGDSYPDAWCALRHDDAWQLLVATMLAAQCTDERVNLVTPGLFERYPDPASLADADPAALETMIHSTGFFRQKAKSLRAVANAVANDFGGDLPRDLDTLVTLPGIGRKTANVVLGTSYGVPSIVVDTHVRRLSQRLGFTDEIDPDKIEMDLQALLPERDWTQFTHRLIHHGRRVCVARKPRCSDCPLLKQCPQIGVSSDPPSAKRRPRGTTEHRG